MKGLNVILYCPDINLRISGDTPGVRSLGGGKTAIIKMAEALSRAGHSVQVFAYCEEGLYGGVTYTDFTRVAGAACDVLIAVTGSKGDLSDLYAGKVRARLRVLWLSGAGSVSNIDDAFFDWYYANSVFLKRRAVLQWKLPFRKVLATHQGYDPADFEGLDVNGGARDPLGVVFASHPSKGYDRVAEVVGRLRGDAGDFTLSVYGGYSLWDDADKRVIAGGKEWITYRGAVSQPKLCRSLAGYGIMLHLTDYEDTSSVLISQAKRAGVIVIASDVGGNSELIENGYDGFIVGEPYLEEDCYRSVLGILRYLISNGDYAGYIRKNAAKHAMTWDVAAGQWSDHWREAFQGSGRGKVVISGYYGFRNLGDEAILDSLIQDIRAADPEAGISVVSGDPFYTEKMHRVRAVPADDFSLQTKEVEGADLVILGGGGLFQDHHRIQVSRFFTDHRSGVTAYANIPLMGRIYRKPVMYAAHGVGPLFSTESCLFSGWAFGLADYISVRDEYSYLMLVDQLGIDRERVVKSCDPVCRLRMRPELADHLFVMNGIPRGKKIVCVSLRRWLNESDEKRAVVNVAEAISGFSRENPGHHFVFVPFQLIAGSENDLVMISEVAERLSAPHSVLKVYSRAAEIIALYREAEFSIGMRYHSLVFSAIAGTPVISLSYDEKNAEFMGELGLDSMSLPLKDFKSAGLLAAMHSLAHASSAEKDGLKEKMRGGLEKMAARSAHDTGAIRTFLKND